MVTLNKIYTRTGDDGQTRLASGARDAVGAAGDLGEGDGLGADAVVHVVPFARRLAAFARRDPIGLDRENPRHGDAEQGEEDHGQAGKGQETLHLRIR